MNITFLGVILLGAFGYILYYLITEKPFSKKSRRSGGGTTKRGSNSEK